jgi:hypothetical protein
LYADGHAGADGFDDAVVWASLVVSPPQPEASSN